MTPYKYKGCFQYRWLRRLIYGRGHGVHSPLAFRLILSVVRPLGSYYAEDEIIMSKDQLLLFRLIARLSPSKLHWVAESPLPQEIIKRAQNDLLLFHGIKDCEDHSLLCTDDTRVALDFANKCRGSILLTGIRQNKEKSRAFLHFVNQIREGVIVDLYDTAIFVYLSDVVYLYRSTD